VFHECIFCLTWDCAVFVCCVSFNYVWLFLTRFLDKSIALQEESNMDEALRHSAVLLGELRTSLLGPQKYYELYMAVNNEMRDLEVSFTLLLTLRYMIRH